MSAPKKDAEKRGKATKKEEKRDHASEPPHMAESDTNSMAELLAELRNLRREHTDASQETKASLSRVEITLQDVLDRTSKLEQQFSEVEQRVSDTEDKARQHERAIRYLLHREAKLTARCEDLESRARRNNLRIFGVKEGEEKDKMVSYINKLLRASLDLPEGLDLCVERAHRSLTMKPHNSSPPRSIIVRFSDYRLKDKILQMAWKKREVKYQDQRIFFDQDYTADVQRKRKQVREVIKQLREKKLKAQSPFPAQLKIHLDSGVKIFKTLADAAPVLREMGIAVQIEEREKLQKQLMRNNWDTAQTSKTPGLSMTDADWEVFVQAGNK